MVLGDVFVGGGRQLGGGAVLWGVAVEGNLSLNLLVVVLVDEIIIEGRAVYGQNDPDTRLMTFRKAGFLIFS